MLRRIQLLKHPDIGALLSLRRIEGSEDLGERAENLAEVLLTLQARSGRLPQLVEDALRLCFPGASIRLEVGMGRVALTAEEDGVKLNSPNMPDGLIKLLAISTAASLGPSILLIDEIENSMHAALLEHVIDMLNSLGVPVLVATHSPLVVDIVGPERIIIVRREPGEPTRLERLSDKKEVLKKLAEVGVSLGDAVFYRLTRED